MFAAAEYGNDFIDEKIDHVEYVLIFAAGSQT
jgi:hypothetical protein